MESTSWKKLLEPLLHKTGDTLVSIVVEDGAEAKFVELDSPEMTEEFDPGYGGTEGCPFTAWGKRFIYYPYGYDGAEWVDYIPRNPCLEAKHHY